ncbi:magnesium-dependent phosphatase 1-like isoform X3 [Dermochelys coriacea]|uniref:magnesium-dependent phosphatase 1-like isoform X3 n=1 Tax=Dermochelys coriacea TaxID=27794 RepID=UPI0018E7B37C|nr:magnesium-dependent phosphatase 1-like isoform X3 [Dermochelys coriacea]
MLEGQRGGFRGVSLPPCLWVLALDYTLWPFWVDTHVDPPFQRGRAGSVLDARSHPVRLYAEVLAVLEQLQDLGVPMAAASRTGETRGATQLLELFGVRHFLRQVEIYPGGKSAHFHRCHLRPGPRWNDPGAPHPGAGGLHSLLPPSPVSPAASPQGAE